MKIKTILITAVIVVGAGAATSFFVRRSHESNIKQVEVIPVASVNSAAYSMGDSGTISGSIVSKDTQVVSLDTSHELVNVYVQQGDRVKKGDKLLEYDMLGDELKEEMEELTKMGLELTLEGMKRDLATLQSGRIPESMGGGVGEDDSDDFSAEGGEDDDDEDDGPSANTDSDGRSRGQRVVRQGGRAVGAADTLEVAPDAEGNATALQRAKDTLVQALREYLESVSTISGDDSDTVVDAVTDPAEDIRLEQLAVEILSGDYGLDVDNNGNIVNKDGYPVDLNLILPRLFGGNGTLTEEDLIVDLDNDDSSGMKPAIEPENDGKGLFEEEGSEGGTNGGNGEDIPRDAIGDGQVVYQEPSSPALTADIVDDDGNGSDGQENPAMEPEEDPEQENDEKPDQGAAAEDDGDGEKPDQSIPAGMEADEPALISKAAQEADPVPLSAMEENPTDGADVVSDDSGTVPDGGLIEEPSGDPAETPESVNQPEMPETAAPAETSAPEEVPADSSEPSEGLPVVDPETVPDASVPEDGIVPEADDEELETNFEGDLMIYDESEEGDEVDIVAEVNGFLSEVNAITLAVGSDWTMIAEQMPAIEAAMEKFRTKFAEADQQETVDLFGENVVVTVYTVSPEVVNQVGNSTAKVMQAAYDRLLALHFINSVLNLNAEGVPSSELEPTWAAENEQTLRAVIAELAALPSTMWIYNPVSQAFEFASEFGAMNNGIFGEESLMGFLNAAVSTVNGNYVMEERTDIPVEVSTEGEFYSGNDSDYDYDSDGYGYSAEELAEAIREQIKNIKETELQIREAQLGIEEYKKILDGKIVYATMDGIVKNAGSSSGSGRNSSYITITGKAGLYAKGTINELELDSVKIGDRITGTSYETGSTFSAEIVEISEYPEESGNTYYGFGDENTNSSYYPFLAYIEDADGLEVDSYVELSLSNSGAQTMDGYSQGGLALEEYYIRTDNNGRSFCYVRGEDGLLEKRYRELGANNWGVVTVKSGLTPNDCIAFPYGDGVEEGAQTVKVDSLSAVDGDVY